MTHDRSADSDRGPLLSWVRAVMRIGGSLQLAVVLISALGILLAWATVVESRWGTEAVQFAVYGTWWFMLLGVLLAVNVFCAAMVRFPWKKHQTGFVVTHLGLLVLLAGFLVGRLQGIDARLPVFEGQANRRAVEDSQHFALEIVSHSDTNEPLEIRVPFRAGPFNWQDYADLTVFPWRVARRDRGVLWDRDGIKLEVLGYYADSLRVPGPSVNLSFKRRTLSPHGPSGTATMPVQLRVNSTPLPHGPPPRWGMGERRTMPSGHRVVFWMTGEEDQTEAFRQSAPEGPLGKQGRMVLHAAGQTHQLAVDSLEPGNRVPLGTSGLELEFVRFDPRFLAVQLKIHREDKPARSMVLFADLPELSQQDLANKVFGTFWYDTGQRPEGEERNEKMLRQAEQPRIDILQGADRRLYWRAWHAPTASVHGLLGEPGQSVTAFEGTKAEITFSLDGFLPMDTPGTVVMPVKVDKAKAAAARIRAARVRLTVDGASEEFWLEGLSSDPVARKLTAEQRRVVEGNGRSVALSMPLDWIDLGFQVRLERFNRKLDPGTSQASHYSSLVDFVDIDDPTVVLQKDLLITLNAPQDITDPDTGRSYRLFQQSFSGPWQAGEPIFEKMVAEDDPREQLFLSWLTVNYDPGRGLKYLGSLLIVLGIAIIYYMKAYFFAGRKTDPNSFDSADSFPEP